MNMPRGIRNTKSEMDKAKTSVKSKSPRAKAVANVNKQNGSTWKIAKITRVSAKAVKRKIAFDEMEGSINNIRSKDGKIGILLKESEQGQVGAAGSSRADLDVQDESM